MIEERRNESEEERVRRRRARIEEMKRQKRRAEFLQRRVFPLALAAVLLLTIVGIVSLVRGRERVPNGSGVIQAAGDTGAAGRSGGSGEAGAAGQPGGSGGAGAAGQPGGSGGAGAAGQAGDDGSGQESSDSSSVPMRQTGAGQTQTPVGQMLPQDRGKAESRSGQQAARQSGAHGETADGREPESEEAQGQDFEGYGPFPETEWWPKAFSASATVSTAEFSSEVISEYGVVVDVENGVILAQRAGRARMYPASMTKILTVLTAADALGILGKEGENSPVLDEKFTITIEITDYSFVNDCSNVGFEVGEEVTVRDLFYGTILPSGADAAMGLAYYVAGSHEAFVELMNQELERLKLLGTSHFTNCVGIFDEEHYSTAYDMAVILKTAADNPFCRKVLSTHIYTTSPTGQHPEGMTCSNWFLRKIEDKDTHGEVICGKTGYVVQSRSCAASLAQDVNGREYICVTAGSAGSSKCINDHVALYQTWLAGE